MEIIDEEYNKKLAYVAHAGFLDLFLNGYRKHFGPLTYADIKILRALRANKYVSKTDMIVSDLVALTIQLLNTSERSARERLKNLQLDGFLVALPGEKKNQTVLQMSKDTEKQWELMEIEFYEQFPTFLKILERYQNRTDEVENLSPEELKYFDPLHPDHARTIIPRSFTQRGH